MSSRPHTYGAAHESGFTLIELIVSTCIMLVVIAALTRALIDSFGSVNHGTAYVVAHQAVNDALVQVKQDVDPAHANDRTPQKVRNWRSLMDALTTPIGQAWSEDPAALGKIDVYDVYQATSTTFAVRSDVRAANPGAECVRYAVTASPYSVRRQVYTNQNCTAGLQSKTLIQPQTTVTAMGGATPTFQYQLTCNASKAPAWATVTGPCSGRSTCAPLTVNSVSNENLNAITAVLVDFHDVESRAGQASGAANSILVPFTSRATTTYQRALGCA